MAVVTFKGVYTVKPAVSTWKGKMSLSELDQIGIITHVPTVYFYKPQKTLNFVVDSLRLSLSKALVHFYPLSGRLCSLGFGRVELDCNEMGVQFIEAVSEWSLDHFHDFSPSLEFNHLIPKVDYTTTPINEQPLLLVQLTQFKCGGLCLSLSVSHLVVDGQSALHFISEWARIARGEPLGTPPFLDRKVVIDLANKSSCQPFDQSKFAHLPIVVGKPYNIEATKKNTAMAMLKLNEAQVETLKKMANGTGEPGTDVYLAYTRYETITAHMWKCVCKARKHKQSQLTALGMTVDSRKRMQPPLPDRYFGNATLDVIAKCNSHELISKPLWYAASKIREAIKKVTSEYVSSAITFLKNEKDLTRFQDLHAIRCVEGHFYENPNMEIVSWLTLPLYDMDFGWGKEIYMGPGPHNCDGDSLLLPDHDRDGCIIVALCLQGEHIEDFKHYFYEDISI